ncbi:MAG: CubicO group peptidase (beta-lactamase class C family) [Planctomycetota bacterium]|jgi:CubicO group peptidase (beta-lactamase class C family)
MLIHLCLALTLQDAAPVSTPVAAPYVPLRGTWETRGPADAGFHPARLAEAIGFAKTCASETPVEIDAFIRRSFGHELFSDIVGPTKSRAETNGMLIRGGYLVAEWGDTARPDMTFSVTKCYLSSVVGLAADRGLLQVDEPVGKSVPLGQFEGARHGRITWDHLLRQTSDWRGTLFGKPAWADRPPRGATAEEAMAVAEREPGSSWEYNDVCVNLLAYAALEVLREPLPQVLRREIMDPIGASSGWRWHGYSTSWVTLDGAQMQSVSGGGHHGGGMFVSTRDQARFGLLCLRRGVWGDLRLLSEDWIAAARTPTDVKPDYGYMNWFLNAPGVARDGTPTRVYPAAPESAVMFRGAGTNLVYIDDVNDVVLCLRWVDHGKANEIIARVLGALEQE